MILLIMNIIKYVLPMVLVAAGIVIVCITASKNSSVQNNPPRKVPTIAPSVAVQERNKKREEKERQLEEHRKKIEERNRERQRTDGKDALEHYEKLRFMCDLKENDPEAFAAYAAEKTAQLEKMNKNREPVIMAYSEVDEEYEEYLNEMDRRNEEEAKKAKKRRREEEELRDREQEMERLREEEEEQRKKEEEKRIEEETYELLDDWYY